MILERLCRLAESRRLALSASIVLLTGFGAAGASVFPFMTGMPDVTAGYRVPYPVRDLVAGRIIPVYDMNVEGRSIRSGQAVAESGGDLRMSRFDRRADGKDGRTAVMLPANVRTLWALANDEERAELRAAGHALFRAFGNSLEEAATSPAFERDYMPAFNAMLKRAAKGAWNAEGTQAAFVALTRIAEPSLMKVAADGLQPALLERLTPAVWQVVRNNTLNLLDVFSADYRFDTEPVRAAVAGALADRKVQAGLADMLDRLSDTPQMRALTERFGFELVRRLREDPQLGETLSRLMADARFSGFLSSLGEPALTFVRAVPRTLARLEERADLNSLAADIFKMQARGVSSHVIIYMSPQQRDKVAAVDPSVPVALVREGGR